MKNSVKCLSEIKVHRVSLTPCAYRLRSTLRQVIGLVEVEQYFLNPC